MDSKIKEAATEINKANYIRLISHYDADGISAAAIALSALTRLGKKIHLSTERQLKPNVIERLKKERPDLFIFTDLGSGQLEMLNELAESSENKIIVLDHHIPSSTKAHDNIIHINPCLVNKGENEISGAGVTYLLARELDPKNKTLSYLAVVGAIGDIQDENWVLNGMNKKLLEEATDEGILKKDRGLRLFGRTKRPIHKALEYSTDPYIPGITGDESAAVQFLSDLGINLKKGNEWRTLEDLSRDEMKKLATAIICERIMDKEPSPEEIFGNVYTLKLNEREFDVREMATTLNACGRMGMASLGILYALGTGNVYDRIEGIITGYKRMIAKYMTWIRENEGKIKKTQFAYYILAEDNIHENFIGTVTSICEKSIFNDRKVVFGLAFTDDGEIKVSARAPKEVIEKGLSLKELFKKIPEDYGYGGGHVAAGGAFIKRGKEKEFIDICEKYLKDVLGSSKVVEVKEASDGNA